MPRHFRGELELLKFLCKHIWMAPTFPTFRSGVGKMELHPVGRILYTVQCKPGEATQFNGRSIPPFRFAPVGIDRYSLSAQAHSSFSRLTKKEVHNVSTTHYLHSVYRRSPLSR